jgi:hypothetical protein
MPDYFTNVDITGGIRRDGSPASIGVIEKLHEPDPIGVASLIGQTDEGLALWRLQVRGAEVPGRWVVLGKWFVADEG